MANVSAPRCSTRDNTGVPGTGVPVASPYRGQGRVLGAWSTENTGGVSPVLREEQCDPATGNCHLYAWVQGTSMMSWKNWPSLRSKLLLASAATGVTPFSRANWTARLRRTYTALKSEWLI